MISSKRRFRSAMGTGRRSRSCDSKNRPDWESEAAKDCIHAPRPAADDVDGRPCAADVEPDVFITPSGLSNQPAKELGRCNRPDKDLTGFSPGRDDINPMAGNTGVSRTFAISSEGATSPVATNAAGDGVPPTRATDVPASGNRGTSVSAPLRSRATCIESREYSETPGIGRLEKK